jgi:aldehyde dehydrogenase (NAD+)/coniferyl-aldehyde dehydrogenase
LQTRLRRLDALERLVAENLDRIAAAIDADFSRRPQAETGLLEGFPTLEGIRHARRHLAKWMRPKRGAASFWFLPARTMLLAQPLGVVGIVAPWNYPMLLAFSPLAAALAAGNRAMIKMSEVTPRTAEALSGLVKKYFQENEVAVVQGGPEIGAEFVKLPFAHLLYTGSGGVGRSVMRSAAENLTPVTLELGGKSPVIVAPDYPFAHAAERTAFGKCVNAGQTCVAPDYLMVEKGREGEMLLALREAITRMYPDLAANPDFAHIVSGRHFERLQAMLEEARAAGTAIEPLSSMPAPDPARRRFPPLALLDPPPGSRVMREEIFGPLLPILGYRDHDAAIEYVNGREKPLALYLFDRDAARVRRTLERTLSGGVTVNDVILHVGEETLPFGGVGPSGMGAYHGKAGFETFSKLRPVFLQSRWAGSWMINPPYGRRFERVLRWMLGR